MLLQLCGRGGEAGLRWGGGAEVNGEGGRKVRERVGRGGVGR
jgi:hypothetical protein